MKHMLHMDKSVRFGFGWDTIQSLWRLPSSGSFLLCLFLLVCVVGCTGGASVTRTSKGGYHATSGYTLLAKRQNVVAEVVTREGDTIRYSTTEENSTEVPNTLIGWHYGAKITKSQQPAILKGTDDPDVIPKDPNKIPKDPNIIPLDPNKLPR
jgi:hypothetical protein